MKNVIEQEEFPLSMWQNVTIDEMVEAHTTPNEYIVNKMEVMRCMGEEEPVWEKEELPMFNKEKLKLKYMSMSDLIINRCFGSKGKAKFNSRLFQKLYGDYYIKMLDVLKAFKLIDIDITYDIGDNARTIWLTDWKTTTKMTNHVVLKKYKDKLNTILSKDFHKRLSNKIVTPYKASLKKIKLDKEKALEFINEKYSGKYEIKHDNNTLTPDKIEGLKEWRIGFVKGFKADEMPKRDTNGRIYHALTNMPKDLLPFTNILFEMDAANCHPMLFVTLLSKYYGINSDTLQQISGYNLTEGEYNDLSKLKELSKTFKLPRDVIKYILLVFKGKFWNVNLEKYNINDRTKIKQNFFAEIFYSYNNRTIILNREHQIIKEKLYAQHFRAEYPNVWKVLGKIKAQGKKALEKQKEDNPFGSEKIKNSVLPNKLMKKESEIFTKILEKLLATFDVINIHDAIVVIDTPKNKMLTPDMVEKTMLDVFRQYNLYPTIKCSTPKEEILEA